MALRLPGYPAGSENYFTHVDGGGFDLHLDIGANCGANCSQPQLHANGNYSTHLFASRALQILEEHDPSVPLFLYMPFQSVHCPIQVPPQYVKPYGRLPPERQQFAGMLSALDEAIGQVVEGFKAKGMWDNTLTVFSTVRPAALSCSPLDISTSSRVFVGWMRLG